MSKQLNRGNLLWEGSRFMLPEHRAALERHNKEKLKVPKPELDEQQLQLFERVIRVARIEKTFLTFTYWEDGYFKSIEGKVRYINIQDKKIHIIDRLNDVYFIHFFTLVDVR